MRSNKPSNIIQFDENNCKTHLHCVQIILKQA